MNKKSANNDGLHSNEWTQYLDAIQVEPRSLKQDSSSVIVSEEEVADINISRVLSAVEDSADRMLDALERISDIEQHNLLEVLGQRRLNASEFELICERYSDSTSEPKLNLKREDKPNKVSKNTVKFELVQNREFDTSVSEDVDISDTGNSKNGVNPIIKLIGVGGGGCNAVQHMVNSNIEDVDFICANTDAQALLSMEAKSIVHIGQSITKGLGAGANPEIGRQAAMEDRDRIQDLIEGTDLLFITAGMGGGTGTGAIPVIAQIAREMGVLTVAVVTKPFPFEGLKRMAIATSGIDELRNHVDSLITIPNEKLLSVLGRNISLLDAFRAANDVLRGAVQGIAELITHPGLINVDFADVRTVMSEMGLAMMGSGIGRGDERATEAAEMAISSPLLEDIDLAGAKGILVNITAGLDMAIGEFEEVGNVVRSFTGDDATVVVGTVIDEALEGELRVTVVVTGLGVLQQAKLRSVVQSAAGSGVRAAGGVFSSTVGPRHGQYSAIVRANSKKPAVKAKTARELAQSPSATTAGHDVEYLDIPAFLRRQAD